MIPRIDPIAAPIRRRRLARLSRISNRMTATEKVRPTIAADLKAKPKGGEREQAAKGVNSENPHATGKCPQTPTPRAQFERMQAAVCGGHTAPPRPLPGPGGGRGG